MDNLRDGSDDADVNKDEVDEALRDPDRLATSFYTDADRQWLLLGKTEAGRLLLVVWSVRREVAHCITVRDATTDEERYYRTTNEQRTL